MQRAVYGVDFATDAGPVSVLQDPAGPTRAGLCHTLEKEFNNSCVQTAPLRLCTNNNIYSPATFFFFWKTIKCFLCNFFCGCGYGNLGWGHMDKSTLHPPPFLSPLARRLLILSHHFSAWHFYYSPISAVKLCRVVAYFCVRLPLLTTSTPILPGWGSWLITLVPVVLLFLKSNFTGKPQLFGVCPLTPLPRVCRGLEAWNGLHDKAWQV